MPKSSVSSKWLTTIPQKVREALKLKIGDKLRWEVTERNGKIVVQVEKEVDAYEALKGKRNDPETTYEKVEHLADKIILNLKEE